MGMGPARAKARSSAVWFESHYPKGDHDFMIIQMDVATGKAEAMAATGVGGMADWLEENVQEEYMVMKAEAEVVEEVVKGQAFRLVDELFLECDH